MNAQVAIEGLHFSVSQMKAWLRCPRAYDYRYRQGAEPEFMPMPLAFGSAFHLALAYHYSWLMRGDTAPVDEVKARFVDALTLAKDGPVPLQLYEGGSGFEEALAKGLQMLDVTLAHPSARPAKVLGVELPFTVPLFDPATGEVLDEKLKGVIDLITEDEDGHRMLVEHKTSSRRYSSDQLRFDTQLSAYAYYAAQQLGWPEVGLVFSVTTKTKMPVLQIEPVLRDDGDQADFLRTAVGVLKAVDAGISFPVRGWACSGCPYRSRCNAER